MTIQDIVPWSANSSASPRLTVLWRPAPRPPPTHVSFPALPSGGRDALMCLRRSRGNARGVYAAVCASMHARPTTWDDARLEALEASSLISAGASHWSYRSPLSRLRRRRAVVGFTSAPPSTAPSTGYIDPSIAPRENRGCRRGAASPKPSSEAVVWPGRWQVLAWAGRAGWWAVGRSG